MSDALKRSLQIYVFGIDASRVFNPTLDFPTGGLGVSALTGVVVGAVLGAAMLITFYFVR